MQPLKQMACIHKLFEAQVMQTPLACAIRHEAAQLTYRQLNERANQLAHYLKRQGIGPEGRVGICMTRSLDMIVGLMGILKAGGTYVPLDPAHPKNRMDFMMDDAALSVLVTQHHLSLNLNGTQVNPVYLDTEWHIIGLESTEDPISDVTLDHLAYIIYTSGSTGNPKGVMIEHRSLVHYIQTISSAFEVGPDDCMLQFAPLIFDASAEEIFPPLISGGSLLLRTNEMLSYDVFIEQCTTWGVTILDLPMAYWHDLTDWLVSGNRALPEQVRLMIIGAEKSHVERVRAWQAHVNPEVRLVITYGPTEATIVATMGDISGPQAVPFDTEDVPIGKIIPGAEAYVLDTHNNPVPTGAVGELYIGGICLARGYLNHPDLTAERFINHPFSDTPGARLYKTGDLVRQLPDERIVYLGRADSQVKIRGFRIELREIDLAMLNYPEVKKAVTIVREDMPGDKRLVAYLVPHDSTEFNLNDLKQDLKDHLPHYMLPSAFVMMGSFPMLLNDKVDRKALPVPDITNQTSVLEQDEILDDLQRQLKIIWQEVLGIDVIGIHDNFFEMGGHSLLALRLFARIQDGTNHRGSLPLSLLIHAPTIAQLADQLRQKQRQTTALVPIQPHGTKPPFFCVHGHLGNVLNFVDLAKHLGTDQPFYGLQAIGLTRDQIPLTRIEDMANRYIQEIQTVQPEGPYFLGGYCFGGLVAQEMAYQLQSQGQTVAFLGLFDVIPELYPNLLANSVLQYYKAYTSRHLLTRYLDQMKEKSLPERLTYLGIGFVRKIRIWTHYTLWRLLKDQDQLLSKLFHNVESTNELALERYVSRPYPGDVTLFQSQEIIEAICPEDPVADWSELATGRTTLCLVEDGGVPNVGKMFKEPVVQNLAQLLVTGLTRAIEKDLDPSVEPIRGFILPQKTPKKHGEPRGF